VAARRDSADVSTDECIGNDEQTVKPAGLDGGSSLARAKATFDDKGSLWNRRVWQYRSGVVAPVLRVRDEFRGPGARDPKIFLLTLMAGGPIETTVGLREVPLSPAPAKPPAGEQFALTAGITRFGSKGQWGVDFDVFVVADTSQQARVTGWKHSWHQGREVEEYKRTTGKSFEESQYILRLRGSSAFDVLTVPLSCRYAPARSSDDQLCIIGVSP
jgi:hypothetical protein